MARRRGRGRGEGTIGQQDGRWFAYVSLGYDEAGKRIRKRVYADSKADAMLKLREMQDQAARGGIPEPGTMTVGQLFDTWLSAMRPAWEPGTYTAHEQHVRNHARPVLGAIRLRLLSALHVQKLVAAMEANEVSAAMRRHVLVTVRAALAYAVKMNLTQFNAA